MNIGEYFGKYGVPLQERYLPYIPRPNRIDSAGVRQRLNGIVAHTEGASSIAGTADRDLYNWFANPNNGAATHGYITFSGKFIMYVPIEHGVWGTALPGVDCATFQVETQDNGRYNNPATYTDAQYRTWAGIYCALYDFTREHFSWCSPIEFVRGEKGLFGHNDFNKTRACPGALDLNRIIREAKVLYDQVNKPQSTPDNLYKILLDGVQQGAYNEQDNAFNKWSENFAQKVVYNGVDITFQFIEMAKPLQQQITELSRQVEELLSLNEKQQQSITELNLDLKSKEELISMRDEQLTKTVEEKEKLQKEVKELQDMIKPKEPFNLFLFIISLFKRK